MAKALHHLGQQNTVVVTYSFAMQDFLHQEYDLPRYMENKGRSNAGCVQHGAICGEHGGYLAPLCGEVAYIKTLNPKTRRRSTVKFRLSSGTMLSKAAILHMDSGLGFRLR